MTITILKSTEFLSSSKFTTHGSFCVPHLLQGALSSKCAAPTEHKGHSKTPPNTHTETRSTMITSQLSALAAQGGSLGPLAYK